MTETESMVERVAKAMCAADGYLPDAESNDGEGQMLWTTYAAMARAAIEAMPFAEDGSNCPEAVRIAGEEAYAENGDARAIFNAMIAAALK